MGAVSSKEYTQTDPARYLMGGAHLQASIFLRLEASSGRRGS
jgi:hypothetical protein